MQPYFYSVQEFLAMGKHGSYVWSSWGFTLIVIIGFIIYSVVQRQRLLKQLNIQQTRQNQHQRKNPSHR